MPPRRDPLSSTRVLAASLAALALAALVFVAAPTLDITVAAWFAQGHGRFGGDTAAGRGARQALEIVPLALFGVLAALTLLRRFGGVRVWAPSGAGLAMLALSLALGPGLLVNGVLKNHSHRPRPVQVDVFGGPWAFRPFYRVDGACERNCSFVSGEGALGFWTVAPALLVPAPYRAATVAAALVFGCAAGGLRMAFGGHFLSDVVFAGLFTWLVILACWRLVARLTGRAPDEPSPTGVAGTAGRPTDPGSARRR